MSRLRTYKDMPNQASGKIVWYPKSYSREKKKHTQSKIEIT